MNKIWKFLINGLMRYKWQTLGVLMVTTFFFSYAGLKVDLDYNFTKALPETDSVYIQFEKHKALFGADANLMFIGFTLDDNVDVHFFRHFVLLQKQIEQISGVTNVWSLENIVRMKKDQTPPEKFVLDPFIKTKNLDSLTQKEVDEALASYLKQPVFKNLFYNPFSNYLAMIVTVDGKLLGKAERVETMEDIKLAVNVFSKQHTTAKAHISGMPFILVEMASRMKKEMVFLIGASALVSLLILLWCFRSLSVLGLAVVIMAVGIMWSFGFLYVFGYGITLLNSLTPTLVVIIGIPNCIYILNAYRARYIQTMNKKEAVQYAIEKMGFITLVCNVIAAIGFYAFAFTSSPILVEFGLTAGTSILALFPIALILMAVFIDTLPAPKINPRYRRNVLELFTRSIRSACYTYIQSPVRTLWVSALVIAVMAAGIFYLKNNAYVFDGVPQKTSLYNDLKFFEQELKGVFNIDLFIESKRAIPRDLELLANIDRLCEYVKKKEYTSNFSLSLTEGFRFLRQSFYDNDPSQYTFPTELDFAFMYPYVKNTLSHFSAQNTAPDKDILRQFITKDEKMCKVSFFLENIGSEEMRVWKEDVLKAADSILGKKVSVTVGGSGVAFVRGNEYVMAGLKDSILLSLILISICIFLVFKKPAYILISIVPNLVPLVIMLGLMGWTSIDLNPSTVIIFGVAFGVANDLTLRIMISYAYHESTTHRWLQTFISSTPSVIFTSLVFIFGFSVFCISDMKNVFYLGLLMSVSMILAALSNLIILPVLLKLYEKKRSGNRHSRTL